MLIRRRLSQCEEGKKNKANQRANERNIAELLIEVGESIHYQLLVFFLRFGC